jgi:hypothetical protein
MRRNLLCDLRRGRRIESEEVRDERDHDAAHAEAASDHPHPAPVLYVAAGSLVAEFHHALLEWLW